MELGFLDLSESPTDPVDIGVGSIAVTGPSSHAIDDAYNINSPLVNDRQVINVNSIPKTNRRQIDSLLRLVPGGEVLTEGSEKTKFGHRGVKAHRSRGYPKHSKGGYGPSRHDVER